jgi:hypothetical protein
MSELDAGDRLLLLDEACQPPQRLDEFVVPDAEVAHSPAAAPLDLGRFDDDQSCAARSKFSGVHQVPVGRKSLLRRVLMHRRHDDPVAERHVAQRHRLEQQRLGHRCFPTPLRSRCAKRYRAMQ